MKFSTKYFFVFLFSQPANDANGNGDQDENRKGSSTGSQRLRAHEVSMEEYNELSKRLDTMESSVGFVLAKVFFLSSFHHDEKKNINLKFYHRRSTALRPNWIIMTNQNRPMIKIKRKRVSKPAEMFVLLCFCFKFRFRVFFLFSDRSRIDGNRCIWRWKYFIEQFRLRSRETFLRDLVDLHIDLCLETIERLKSV